ncbi:UTRA domain-containing protein [Streptomyces capparidis]
MDVQEIEAPALVSRVLELGSSASVLARIRKFIVDGRPVQLATSYYPADLVRGSQIEQRDTGPGGAYARLAELEAKPERFTEELRCRVAGEDERESLDLPPGAHVIEICRTAFAGDGKRVEFTQMVLDAGSYILEYRLEG